MSLALLEHIIEARWQVTLEPEELCEGADLDSMRHRVEFADSGDRECSSQYSFTASRWCPNEAMLHSVL